MPSDEKTTRRRSSAEDRSILKTGFSLFLYLSLLALAFALYRGDFLEIPQIISYPALGASLVFLFLGFVADVVLWQKTLARAGCGVSLPEALRSVSLSVFGKYIPGKVWTIVGRAGCLAAAGAAPLSGLVTLALTCQLVTVWVGLSLGGLGLLILDGLHLWGALLVCAWVLLTVVLFSARIHRLVQRLFRSLIGSLPRLYPKQILSLLPWSAASWLLWAIGFHLAVSSLVPGPVPLSTGLGFPLAATLGIIAVIAPGGLGVREGILVGYLVLAGLDVVTATTISVFSRLWFLGGEVFVFAAGAMLARPRRVIG
jgi:uncharacterized membrane protein YbhN (UPF0104 family)